MKNSSVKWISGFIAIEWVEWSSGHRIYVCSSFWMLTRSTLHFISSSSHFSNLNWDICRSSRIFRYYFFFYFWLFIWAEMVNGLFTVTRTHPLHSQFSNSTWYYPITHTHTKCNSKWLVLIWFCCVFKLFLYMANLSIGTHHFASFANDVSELQEHHIPERPDARRWWRN